MKMGRRAAIVLVVAVAFRALYCYLVWTPIMKSPEESMSKMYVRTAYLVAAGLGHSQAIPGSPAYFDIEALREKGYDFGTVVDHAAADTMSTDGLYPETLHPPGWPLVAAGVHKALHVPVWFGMQVLGILADALACLLLYRLAILVFESSRIALLAAWIYALFPPLAYEVAGLKPMAFMSFFSICATLMFVLGLQSESQRKRWLYVLASGLIIGIGSYFRSDVLLLGPFLALAWMWQDRIFWKPVLAGILTILIAIAVLWPWSAYTHEKIGKRVLTSTALGINLVNGLGEFPNPWGIGGSDADRMEDARNAGLPYAFHPSADSLFKRMFAERVKEHPLAYVRIVALRLATVAVATPFDWGLKIEGDRGLTSIRAEGELLRNVSYIVQRYWPHLISASFMFLCLVSTIYMTVKERESIPLAIVFVLVPLYFVMSHAVIHMEPRYLIPSSFGLFIGMAYVIHTIILRRLATKTAVHGL